MGRPPTRGAIRFDLLKGGVEDTHTPSAWPPSPDSGIRAGLPVRSESQAAGRIRLVHVAAQCQAQAARLWHALHPKGRLLRRSQGETGPGGESGAAAGCSLGPLESDLRHSRALCLQASYSISMSYSFLSDKSRTGALM